MSNGSTKTRFLKRKWYDDGIWPYVSEAKGKGV